MDPEHQRQADQRTQPAKEPSAPSVSSVSPYTQDQASSSPGTTSPASYYSPDSSFTPANGLYSQRPLPTDFPPPPVTSTAIPSSPGTSNPWQHHHYISTSSASAFPQSQDRYICSTCNKAFSRPSSLRIHSHSHTGEKPYKCPQPGCGKAFSVRSNMKRHERGCHAAANAIAVS
ncbi:hypothetical protein EJ05DRAFT_444901 [Pseudovirgaria hyperparasitica]|uniref:C2H2-type domain-containing protein n=1 Tax=Pseudovirgaria hyperparasitica TaxID=470096 RepID=A0A6A6VRY4_9PEZI|nr:uncharacterized protein EJ05DRAFT_444901 [Pseudovirgaria hyperparasitica]KAF2753352.1 hypothetical protein EJ05DRAFT_444901 [Pseudovirgaria hyperparasitica]